MRNEDPVVAMDIRVQPDDRLPGQVLGDVGNEAVLPEGKDDVVGLEQESVEIGPVDPAPPPGRRDGPHNDSASLEEAPVAPFDRLDRAAAPGEEEGRLVPASALGLRLRLTHDSDAAGAGLFGEPLALGGGLGFDALRLGVLFGAPAPILPLLCDELLLTPGQLDSVLKLVLCDRALLLDCQRAPLEGRLVRLLLDGLARRHSTSAFGRTAATRTETISRPIPVGRPSAARPSAILRRICATPAVRRSRSGVWVRYSHADCWASWVSRPATCSRGSLAQRPVAGPIVKSIRVARVSGSTTR